MSASRLTSDQRVGPKLVLASASPRRSDLLRQLGCTDFLVDPSDVDESTRTAELPRVYAARVARLKADAQRERHAGHAILSADTVVAVGRRILPKTENIDEARACLKLLSGRAHRVFGGICLITPQGKTVERLVETRVTVARLSAADLERYLDSGEWSGKAGGYAIQGRFAAHIPKLSGSYSNVVGLSLFETATLLHSVGLGFGVDAGNAAGAGSAAGAGGTVS